MLNKMSCLRPVWMGALLALAGFQSCGGGKSEDTPEIVLSFGSATTVEVDAFEMGLEIPAANWVSVRLVAPVPLVAVRDGAHFRIWSIPLGPGDNLLELEAEASSGVRTSKTLLVHNSNNPTSALRVSFNPEICQPGEPVYAALELDTAVGDPIEILVDLDRDGRTDLAQGPGEPLVLTFANPGVTTPRVSVRAQGGMLFSNVAHHTRPVRCLPTNDPRPSWAPAQPLPSLTELEPFGIARFVGLAPSTRSALVMDMQGSVLQQIPLLGCVAPSGLAADTNGDLYIADSGAHTVVKLSAALSYGLDPTFGVGGILGEHGADPLEFDTPNDVAVVRDVLDQKLRIFIADTGNRRVQVVDKIGKLLRLSAGTGGPGGWAAFSRPTRLVTLAGGSVAVLDSEQRNVRALGTDGVPIAFGLHGNDSGGYGLVNPVSISTVPFGGQVLIGDAAGPRAHLFSSAGTRVRTWVLDRSPHSLAWLSVDPEPRLLVAGDGFAGGLVGHSVLEDPQGFGPTDAARAAVNAVVAGDPMSGPIDEALAASIIEALSEDSSASALLAALQGVEVFTLTSVSGAYSIVQGRRKGQEMVALQLVLKRNDGDSKWSVVQL